MSLLRHTLEEERHEQIPADGDPYGVPTGVVPRYVRAAIAPDHPDGLTTLPDFGTCGAAIQDAVDRYVLMERKAAAWDELYAWIEKQQPLQVWSVSPGTMDGILRRVPDR